jgi:hypothetical protein
MSLHNEELTDQQKGVINYLQDLYNKALAGSIDAADELSRVALSGHLLAQELVQRYDKIPRLISAPLIIKSEKSE